MQVLIPFANSFDTDFEISLFKQRKRDRFSDKSLNFEKKNFTSMITSYLIVYILKPCTFNATTLWSKVKYKY